MTKPDILNTIDERLAGFMLAIQQRQAAYFAAKGTYFQGLRSHSVTPAATDTAPDNLTAQPHDQPVSWLDVAPDFPAETLSNIEMHISDGPSGAGYSVILTTRVDGVEWQRIAGFEANAGRTMDWFEVETEWDY